VSARVHGQQQIESFGGHRAEGKRGERTRGQPFVGVEAAEADSTHWRAATIDVEGEFAVREDVLDRADPGDPCHREAHSLSQCALEAGGLSPEVFDDGGYSHGPDHFFDLKSDSLEQRDLVEENSREKDLLLQELNRVYERLDPRLTQMDELEINPEHLSELKQLGYIE
jgi:hypothetical protein